MDFYEILLSIMEEKSLTIPDVARLTGLADSTIRSIISRKTKNISLEVAFKMSNGLDVSLERLNGESLDNSNLIKNQYKNLNNDELLLISDFNSLNDLGKKEAKKRVSELTEIPKYINTKYNTYVLAAHDDDLDDEEAKANLEKAKALFREMDEE